MDIPPIDIDLLRQDPESNDCLRACALMVFKYYNAPISKEVLWRKLHVYKKHSGLEGAYLQDLGKLAIGLGYKAVISHYDFSWWDEDTFQEVKNGKKALISALKKLKNKKTTWPDKKNLDKDIQFVKAGGIFQTSLPKLNLIDNYLLSRVPVILITQAQFLYHQLRTNFKHSINVVGKQADRYLIKDPLYALDTIDEKELFYSWCKASGWALVILPKEKQGLQLIKQQRLKL